MSILDQSADIARFLHEEFRPQMKGVRFISASAFTDAMLTAVAERFGSAPETVALRGALIAQELAIADLTFELEGGA